MRKLLAFALMLATVVPAAAQTTKRISQYPAAAALTGSERQLADQGNGCASSPIAPPCTTVYITPAQISAYLQGIIAPTLALSNPSGDTVLSLTANTASATVAYDRLDFGRIGGTVNAQIRHASQIANDYGYLEFWTRGTDGFNCRSRLDLAGYFGVLTCAPQAPLDVNGSAIVRGNVSATGTFFTNATSGAAYFKAQFNGALGGYFATDSTLNTYIDTEGAAIIFQNKNNPVASISANGTFAASNFSGSSSGTNTGDNANTTGNAGTATRFQTARAINGVAFDGSAAITINAVDSTPRAALSGAAFTGAVSAPSLSLAQPSSGDATLTLSATTAAATPARDAIDFQRAGGTVNASIVSQAQISNDYAFLDFYTRGTDGYNCRSRLDLAGYFGILTCAPQTPLDVNGSATIRGNVFATSTFFANATSGASYFKAQFNGSLGGYFATDATLNAYIDTEGASIIFQNKGTAVASISTNGTVIATSLQTTAAATVGALSACNAAARGSRAVVTDANSPVFLGTLTGGGSITAPAFCNGSNWVAG